MNKQVRDILRHLVAFDTTSRNSNLQLIAYVEDLLGKSGIESARVSNDEKTKAHLIARIGPNRAGGILLSGHTDVVPVDGQDWDSDPFELTEKGGKLYGRGTADMKGFIACVLAKAQEWSKLPLQRPIYIALSYDEEIASFTVKSAVEYLQKQGASPELCIIGEPTGGRVANAHKSRANVFLLCKGTGGHASVDNDPKVTSAFDLASGICVHFKTKNHIIGNDLGHPTMTPASLAVTGIDMVSTSNVIPAKAQIRFDLRGKPGITADEIIDVLNPHAKRAARNYQKTKTGDTDIQITAEVRNPGFRCDDPSAIDLGTKFAGASAKSVRPVPFVSEAPYYHEVFEKVLISGPGGIEQAHQPNEYVTISDLKNCMQMLGRITNHVLTPR